MKKLSALFIVALIVFASCAKKESKCPFTESDIVAPASEQEALKDSLSAKGIEATMDPSGFFYKINNEGTGSKATSLCSTVAVYYRGGFLNGNGFDSTSGNPAVFQLGQVIPGWQKALPLIATSGKITLYIPPSLAYGSKEVKDPATGRVIIPANSNLVFDVALVDVQ